MSKQPKKPLNYIANNSGSILTLILGFVLMPIYEGNDTLGCVDINASQVCHVIGTWSNPIKSNNPNGGKDLSGTCWIV